MSRKTAKFNISAENKTKKAFKEVDKSLGNLKGQFGSLAMPGMLGGAIGGAGMLAGLKDTVGVFAEYEEGFTDMRKVTDESIESIRKRIESLSPTLGNQTQLMRGYYQVISAGVTEPVAAIEALTVSSKAAKAAHLDQASTIKALTKFMEGYGDELKDVTEASDTLFAIERYGQTSFAELVPVMGDLASLAGTLNIEVDTLGGSLATLTKTAGSTSQASTQLQAIMTGLLKPTETMREEMAKLGYTSGRTMVDELDLVDTLRMLISTAEESGTELGKLFESKQALIGISAIMKNDFKGVNEVIGGMKDKTGATDRAFEDWKGTIRGFVSESLANLSTFRSWIGEDLAPAVKEVLGNFNEWAAANKELIRDNVKDWVGGVVEKTGELATILKEHGDLIGKIFVYSTITIITAKLITLAGAVASVGAAMLPLLATPIGLGVLAAGGIGISMLMPTRQEVFDEATQRTLKSLQEQPIFKVNIDQKGMLDELQGSIVSMAESGMDLKTILSEIDSIFDDNLAMLNYGIGIDELRGKVRAFYDELEKQPSVKDAGKGTSDGSLLLGGIPYGGYEKYDPYAKAHGQSIVGENQAAMAKLNNAMAYAELMATIQQQEEKALQNSMSNWAMLGDTISDTLAYAMQEHGNFVENMLSGFTRMLETMAAQLAARAAVFGILNVLSGGSFGAFTGGMKGWLGFRASGGPVDAGKPYIVGERGPELIVPRQSGTVIPNVSDSHNSYSFTFNGTPPGSSKTDFLRWMKDAVRSGQVRVKGNEIVIAGV